MSENNSIFDYDEGIQKPREDPETVILGGERELPALLQAQLLVTEDRTPEEAEYLVEERSYETDQLELDTGLDADLSPENAKITDY